MYEAYWQHSDFIRANIIISEDAKGKLEGYHMELDGKRMVYQIAQMFSIGEHQELKTYPVPEKLIEKLQLSMEELLELAQANVRRFSLMQSEATLQALPVRRRSHGR